MNFTFYAASGEVVSSGYGPEEFAQLNCPADGGYIEGEYARGTHYIDLVDPDNPTPTERPTSPVTRADLTLHDVPEGSTLFINGESYPAEGTVELEFPLSGTYALRVECFPFLDWTDEVTV